MYSALPAYNSHAHYELILSHRNAFLYRYEELLYQFTFLRWFVAFVENKRKCVAVMSDVCVDEMMINHFCHHHGPYELLLSSAFLVWLLSIVRIVQIIWSSNLILTSDNCCHKEAVHIAVSSLHSGFT